ncbi:hypothetical protein MKX08_010211 [Trichoderma sp. CBMAI-0020]|nr:hypothetical protein MKX08_010211 [Trichoderma sp. CBMAI-0020]
MSVYGNSASGGAYQKNIVSKCFSLFRSSTNTVIKNYSKFVVNLIWPSSNVRSDEPLEKKIGSMPSQDSHDSAANNEKRVPVDAFRSACQYGAKEARDPTPPLLSL